MTVGSVVVSVLEKEIAESLLITIVENAVLARIDSAFQCDTVPMFFRNIFILSSELIAKIIFLS